MIVKENFDLTPYNSYRIAATCAKAYFPETDEDLYSLFSETNIEKKIVIGGGYNIILSKPHYQESFVIFSDNLSKAVVNDVTLTLQAGISMLAISQLAYEHGLSGMEVFYDIPGSLGGAIVMNAGSGTDEIKNVLVKVKYFDPISLTFHEMYNSEIGFSYRDSFFQRNPHLLITEATLELFRKDKESIKQKMEQTKATRHSKQPKEYPNAGSVFKRPKGKFVGPMIEELGLKGYSVGGAQVSEKHAGFIVNYNKATGADILNLIKDIQDKVYAAYDVMLEVEQRII
ncbi:UDP-N-acetylmuramate dehydrogenase [Mucilaginibacter sp. 14171R-50]|uniref:UDP-N-acetylmuramate dehydrogenase n=1 Tax=Mucilaginibacter sp. 14171R-50 TaxID=2703789 RepID=UPI00138BD729|nr:UDP-N-acetylmuramate dehydrogenase [Mucilaginibacter sp. 14171R-50]QHS54275.1 UDP-N-acetylmuramate dehydrogenase [Mucilaginibacter sp. 14171R-50]